MMRRTFRALSTPLARLALSSALAAPTVLACYGSELGGTAPDVPTTAADADATTSSDADAVTATDATATDATTSPDADVVTTTDATTTDADTSVPPEWESLSLGDIGDVGDVIAVSKTLAYATSGNRVLRWNGATWLAYGEPGGAAAVHGVWAGGGEVVAVGAGGLVARRADGGEWDTLDVGTTEDLWDVDGRGGDDLWVVGDKGEVRHWDGAAWTGVFHKDTVDLRSLWVDRDATGGAGVYAVGTGGQLVSQVGDAFKASQIAGGTVVLSDIVAKADGTLVAVGTGHTITAKRTTDPAWRGQASNDERDRDVAALALLPDDSLLAFGADGLVLEQEGTVWSVVPEAGAAAGLKDFAAAAVMPGSGKTVIVLAAEGTGVRWDGTSWSAIATKPEAGVKDLHADSDGVVWAAGTSGLLMARGANGWSTVTLPESLATSDLEAVAIGADDVVWAVGANGAILRKAPGVVATRVASPVPLDLFGVEAGDGVVVACGRGGTLIAIEGDEATVRASGSVADLRAVGHGGDGALWIVGAFGTLLRAVGDATPEPILSGVGGSLNDLAPVPGGVIAAGDNGVVLFANADGVELLNETPGAFLQGVAVHDDARFAVGWNGLVLHAEANAWVAEETGTNLILEAIWVGADEALAGGRQGILLHRIEAP